MLGEFGIGTLADDPAVVGARIRASNVRLTIVAALDDWSIREKDAQRMDWVTAAARAADPDPTGWRDRVRQLRSRSGARTAAEVAELTELAQRAVPAEQPVPTLIRLALLMRAAGMDPIPFLMRVVQAHPDDVWANLIAGKTLRDAGRAAEGLEYLRAARAVRPRMVAVQIEFADALFDDGRTAEALEGLGAAAAADRWQWLYANALGDLLLRAGRPEEALAAAAEAARLAPPGNPHPPLLRAKALAALGRDDDEALSQFRLAASLDPRQTAAQRGLRGALLRRGEFDAARDAWRAAIALDPPDHDASDGYAELCLYLGDAEEYRRVCALLLRKFAATNDPSECERTARAWLLLPPSTDRVRAATALIDRALAANVPSGHGFQQYYLLAKALADYRAGRYREALAAVDGDGPAAGALVPIPMLIAAMANQQLGHRAHARRALRNAALVPDWSPGEAKVRELWICHILRREAERLIVPDLRAFLDGTYQPRFTDEQVALTAVCQATERHAAEVRLWSDAMAQDPTLVAGCRIRAIRAAARAGCGVGVDAAALDDATRAAWRETARRWMAQELDGAERLAQAADPADRSAGRSAAANARSFASVLREPGSLARMSPEERAACDALFSRADRAAAAAAEHAPAKSPARPATQPAPGSPT